MRSHLLRVGPREGTDVGSIGYNRGSGGKYSQNHGGNDDRDSVTTEEIVHFSKRHCGNNNAERLICAKPSWKNGWPNIDLSCRGNRCGEGAEAEVTV